ncbi:MAG: RluA family pseudouridine synthase [Elusimicrobia bacterium]|nr:RluA family pseudouridine synthase [Elusimicrobiota bacterium]
MRLLDFLFLKFENISISYLRDQCLNENILLDGQPVSCDEIIRTGQIINLKFSLEKRLIFKNPTPLKILFEDDYILAVNKPAGMVVHPGCGHYSDTLINLLMNHFNIEEFGLSSGERLNFGLIGRLDKDSSGLLLVSKIPIVQTKLQIDKTVIKKYLALIEGEIKEDKGRISLPLIRDKENRFRMIASQEGNPAETLFRVEKRYMGYSLLSVEIKTGRTHQIRAHFASGGYPLAGDVLYGGSLSENLGIERLMLHSKSIKFTHPKTQEIIKISAPVPSDMARVLSKLQKKT